MSYCERELTPEYQALFMLFSDMARFGYEKMSNSEKCAKANTMLKQCCCPSVLDVLEKDYIQLLNNLMFDGCSSNEQLAARVERLVRLANNIGLALSSTDYTQGESNPSEEIRAAIDVIRRFQMRITAYALPFQVMVDSDSKTQSVIEKAEKDLHGVEERMRADASRVLEDMTASLEAVKDRAAINHISVLGVFSAVAFVFTGGIGIISDSFQLVPIHDNFALGFLFVAFLGFLFENSIALLLWFVAIIIGKQGILKQEGLCLLAGIDAMLFVVMVSVPILCMLVQ